MPHNTPAKIPSSPLGNFQEVPQSSRSTMRMRLLRLRKGLRFLLRSLRLRFLRLVQ